MNIICGIMYMNWSDVMRRKSNVIAIILIFMMMATLAVVENVRGVFIPLFKADFAINDTSIGVMLFVSSIGYIIFTYLGGELCERIGQKKVFSLGFILILISLILLYFSYRYPVLLIAMFIMNTGLALTAIAVNTIVPLLFISFQAILMNLTHFCYGLGSTFAQRVSGLLINQGVNWRSIYLMEAVLVIFLLAGFNFIKLPEPHKDKAKNSISIKSVLKNKLVYLYIFALGFYVFAEVGTGNWFVNFIKRVYSYNESQSSFYLSLFFGIFTIGRLVGGFIVEKTGYLNTVIVSLIIAFAIFLTGILTGEKGLVVISVSGFFFAIAFPTIVLSIRKVFTENGAYITGIILTCSSIVNMVLNLFIGILNDLLGIYTAFYIIPLCLLISIGCLRLIYINTKERFA